MAASVRFSLRTEHSGSGTAICAPISNTLGGGSRCHPRSGRTTGGRSAIELGQKFRPFWGPVPTSPHLCRRMLPAKPGENRYTSQYYQQSIERIRPVSAEGVAEENGGHCDEQGGNERVAEHAIGPRRLGIAPAEDEDGAARDHVEEPFREDGERKKLTEITSQEQES